MATGPGSSAPRLFPQPEEYGLPILGRPGLSPTLSPSPRASSCLAALTAEDRKALDRLRLNLRTYEVPDCSCAWERPHLSDDEDLPPAYRLLLAIFGAASQPASEPCAHSDCLAHPLSLQEWADLLCRAWPAEMRELPLGDARALLARERRLEVYARRARAGQSVFHPGDLLDLPSLGEQARPGKRGTGEIRTGGAA